MHPRHTFARAAALAAVAGLALSACAPAEDEPSSGGGDVVDEAICAPDQLSTLTEGTITVATGAPAYSPWVLDDAPEAGEGFEAAVAYAVAERLGYGDSDVSWVRTTFDSAIAPGPKTFDWNLQQYSITEDRLAAVDFSSPYYEASQAVLSTGSSAIAEATTLAELKDAKLGAAVGSTSLNDAEDVIEPTTPVAVFNDNAAAVSALLNKQIDGLVIDLPSAYYLRDVEVDDGVIVGQLPGTASGDVDAYGILLAKDSPVTACTTWALDSLRTDGTLAELEERWIQAEGAPVLQ